MYLNVLLLYKFKLLFVILILNNFSYTFYIIKKSKIFIFSYLKNLSDN